MSDFELSVGITGVQPAVQQLGQVGSAIQQAGQQATQTVGATESAGSGLAGMGNQARQVAAHIQGLTGLVASLSTRLAGGGGSALGTGAHLVSSLSGVASQSLALGSVLGPAGAVVGAITGLVPVIGEMVGANEQVAVSTGQATEAQAHWSIELGNSIHTIDSYVHSMQEMQHALSQQSLVNQGLGSVDQQFAAAELAGRRVGELRARDALLHQEEQALDRTDWQNAERLAQITQQRTALHTQIVEAQRESQRLGQLAMQAESDERDIQTDILTIATDEAATADRSAHAHERSAAAAHSQAEDARAAAAAYDKIATAAASAQSAANQRSLDAALAHGGSGHAAARDSSGAVALPDAATNDQIAQFAATADRAATATTRAASAVHSLTAAQAAHAAAAPNFLHAVGGVTDAIGRDMQGALQSSVSAWMDGSKSFVQAAEDMAKGVIKALVTESIVQVVVEGARAIADFASYHYDTGAEHLAAAAAWAAVGVAAGAASAAIGGGGHGGGGGAIGPGSAADTQHASSQAAQQQQQAITLNVYPGGYITQKDVQAALIGAINQAGRSGYQILPQSIRG